MASDRTPEEKRLEQLLTINEDNIAQEWHDQPGLYADFSRHAAYRQAACEEAELAVKIAEAELDEKLRKASMDGKRLTDKAIELAIRRDSTWIAAQNYRIEMRKMSGIADGLQKSAEMRERSLIRLSQRHLGGNLEDDERLVAIVNRLVREQNQRLQRGD